VGPRAVLDSIVKRKISKLRRESNPRTATVQQRNLLLPPSFHYPEDRGCIVLRNIGILPHLYTVSQLRISRLGSDSKLNRPRPLTSTFFPIRPLQSATNRRYVNWKVQETSLNKLRNKRYGPSSLAH